MHPAAAAPTQPEAATIGDAKKEAGSAAQEPVSPPGTNLEPSSGTTGTGLPADTIPDESHAVPGGVENMPAKRHCPAADAGLGTKNRAENAEPMEVVEHAGRRTSETMLSETNDTTVLAQHTDQFTNCGGQQLDQETAAARSGNADKVSMKETPAVSQRQKISEVSPAVGPNTAGGANFVQTMPGNVLGGNPPANNEVDEMPPATSEGASRDQGSEERGEHCSLAPHDEFKQHGDDMAHEGLLSSSQCSTNMAPRDGQEGGDIQLPANLHAAAGPSKGNDDGGVMLHGGEQSTPSSSDVA